MALSNNTKRIKFSAMSKIDDTDVMSMDALYDIDKNTLNFNQFVLDIDIYEANKDEVDSDYATWRAEVVEAIGQDE